MHLSNLRGRSNTFIHGFHFFLAIVTKLHSFIVQYVNENIELIAFLPIQISTIIYLFCLGSYQVFHTWIYKDSSFLHMINVAYISPYMNQVLAVKKLNSTVLPSQSSDDFFDLVSNISKLHHPNLNELVGYCMEHGQHLLVYDFHRNGSLHDMLHLPDEYSKPLSWNSRVKIALGSARALE